MLDFFSFSRFRSCVGEGVEKYMYRRAIWQGFEEINIVQDQEVTVIEEPE